MSEVATTYTGETVIDVRNLVKIYKVRRHPPIRAVDDISFRVGRGEIFGMLGPNGAGKSTTVKLLTTLLTPTTGSIAILGHDAVAQPLEVRRNIVAVLQENAVELFLSVEDNFRTFGRFQGLAAREIDRRTGSVLDLFDLRSVRRQKTIDLSGGLKRRVQVAKVFMVDKPIIFLDEATTGMDTLNKRTVLDALRAEAARGRTIVLTTHVLSEAEELCDRLVIINHGRIIASGTPSDVTALSLRLFYLTATVASMSDAVRKLLASFHPHHAQIAGTTIELSVADELQALAILTALQQVVPIQHFEIRGASLEDAFLAILEPGRSDR